MYHNVICKQIPTKSYHGWNKHGDHTKDNEKLQLRGWL